MNKVDLTVICPAIRSEKWLKMYESIEKSFSGSWELILVTEKECPKELLDKSNIKIIYSERSPLHKQQQALEHVEGHYVTVMSDDQLWYPNKLDEAFKLLNDNYKHMIIMKYTEGPEFQMGSIPFQDLKSHSNYDWMGNDRYYIIQNHDTCKVKGMLGYETPVISTALISTKLLLEMGGWDCSYDVQGISNCDMAQRMIHHGCTFTIFGGHREFCSYHGYMESGSGDHGPLHGAIVEDDEPLLQITYANERPDRIHIDLDNWKRTPLTWKRKPKTPDNIKLSVICPGIRTSNWRKLYESCCVAYSGNWEIIFIGPEEPPVYVKAQKNVRFIHSMRSPIACQQIGLIEAKGEWITWAADDGEYIPGSLDESFRLLEGKDYKTIVLGKYLEGDFAVENKLNTNIYYMQKYHRDYAWLPSKPKEAYILNCGVVSRQLCIELGGWDAEIFEVCPMAYHDFSIRTQKYGAKVIVQDMIMFRCGHEPGEIGSHGPIHRAQIQRDHPAYFKMYMQPSERIIIDVNNWQKSQEVWGERFKERTCA